MGRVSAKARELIRARSTPAASRAASTLIARCEDSSQLLWKGVVWMGTSSVCPSMVTGRAGSSRKRRAISAMAGRASLRTSAEPESKRSASLNSIPRLPPSSRATTRFFSSGERATNDSIFSCSDCSGACLVPESEAAMRSNRACRIGTEAMMSTKNPTSSVSRSA